MIILLFLKKKSNRSLVEWHEAESEKTKKNAKGEKGKKQVTKPTCALVLKKMISSRTLYSPT